MAIDLGLTSDEMATLGTVMCSDHNVRVVVHLMDMNGNRLDDLSWRLQDGQVNIKAGETVTRSADLVLFDAFKTLGFDGDNPSDGALYYDKMIQIYYCVWQTGWELFGGKSVDIPIFRGPIMKMKRNGASININCLGKEVLAQSVIWNTRNYGKGTNKTNAIRSILKNGTGERSFTLQTTKAKTPKKLSLSRTSIPWDEAQRLARSMSMRLFYDGRGVCRMRRDPSVPVFTFRDGTGGSIMSDPDITYDLDTISNRVWVVGANPRGAKAAYSYVATAPESHPLNPYKIGRTLADGTKVPRILLMKIEDTNIRSQAEAERRAKSALNTALLQGLQISMDTLVIPYLEEYDLANAEMQGDYKTPFRIKDMSIPLQVGALASIGTNKNLKLKRRS